MEFSGQQILDGFPLSVVITDLSADIVTVNQACRELLGYGTDENPGKALSDIASQGNIEKETKAIEALKNGSGTSPHTRELVTKSGELIPVEVNVGGLKDDKGKLSHAVLTIKPLSEEMKLLKQVQRRNMQLTASAEVSQAATQILDIQEVLTRCVDLIRTHFGFYYAAVFLIDEQGEWAILRAATGEAGAKLLEQQHKLGVGSQSMVGWVTANNAARIALDVGEEAIRFNNPLLPKTRAEMALPLRVRGEVIGALDAQSTSVNAFSDEDIQTIQMMADQVAIAIDNARLFSERSA